MKYKPDNALVKQVHGQYSAPLRDKLSSLRQLIVKTADSLETLGELEETLKWGQLSFITKKPKTGSTIRIDAVKNKSDEYAMYFHCQTNLVETFKQMYSGYFSFSGNRAIIFKLDEPIPEKQLSHCIALALSYHLNKQ